MLKSGNKRTQTRLDELKRLDHLAMRCLTGLVVALMILASVLVYGTKAVTIVHQLLR